MTIFNVNGGGGGDGSPTFKEMTSAPYSITASDWGNYYSSIRNYQFSDDKLLESIEIPSSVTSIGSNAFQDCTALTDITIPSSVTSIGSNTFQGCTALTDITIPSSVTSIDSNAFYYCTALTDITIPSSVTSIGSSAFQGCTALTDITIASSVTSIGISAFRNCTAMASVTINNPSSLNILSYAFRSIATDVTGGCTITLTGSTPPTIAANTFQSANIAKIIVPQGSLTAYQTATNWSAYAQYMEEAA